MPKLPKKSTMKETINRVMGYANKLYQKGTITMKQYTTTVENLKKLLADIEK